MQGSAVECQPAGDAVGADGLHLVADRDVSVQVRVPGARVAVVERRGDQPSGVDLFDAVGAHAGKGRVVFEEGQSVGDGFVVAGFDGFGDVAGRYRPKGGHRFYRREGEVVTGDRGGGLPAVASDEAAEFALVGGRSIVVIGEQLAPDCGADAGADVGRDGCVWILVVRDVVVGVGGAEPAREGVLGGVDPKGAAELGGGQRTCVRDAESGEVAGDSIGVGVQAFAEERLHLFLADLGAVRDREQLLDQRVVRVARRWSGERGKAATGPPPGGFAFVGVVVGEAGPAAVGRVGGGHLPDQVEVAVAGGQLV
jgi:hypothetical protein